MKNGHPRNTGFIALHRSIQQHWIWDDPEKLKWWLDILLSVNHTEAKVNIGFELMECKRGQSLNSLQTWAKRWRVDVSTVRRFLKLLQQDQMIVTENVRKTTRLTVCNYDDYNNNRQAKQSQSNFETTPTQSQSNTNKNEKEGMKNEKECESGSNTRPQDFGNGDELAQVFASYQSWIIEQAPQVALMKEPLSLNEFISFSENYPAPAGTKLFKQTIRAMNNWEGLHKRRNVFRTAVWWISNEKYDNEIIALRNECKEMLSKTRSAKGSSDRVSDMIMSIGNEPKPKKEMVY